MNADFLDEAEHFLHNRVASVATAPMVFGIIPECRSASVRDQRSGLPESPSTASEKNRFGGAHANAHAKPAELHG
jgi:hypothetical protein